MEPPVKRRRLTASSYPENDLHMRRAQNDRRLKSIFESIFEKYGRDFDGIGDEIDMETGEIVVNNGHLQRMTSERDTGDVKCSSERLGDSDYEDNDSLIEYSKEPLASPGSSKARDAAHSEESEASEQSDFDADSLMGDAPADSHPHKFGKKSRRVVSIPSDDEEDELASSDMEWVSYHEDRLGVQERFSLLKDKPAFLDEPAVDPIWRAPPLPNIVRSEREEEEVELTSTYDTREYSDDERAGISIWTPEVKKRSRWRQANANSTSQRSLSSIRGQENNADGPLSDSIDPEPASRNMFKWTQEEDELLIHLKTTTNISGASLASYFPERQGKAIGSHWNYMVTRGKASPHPQVPTVLGRRLPLSCLSSSTDPLAPGGTRLELHDRDTASEAQHPQTVQQQRNGGFSEAGSFIQSSSKPVAHVGDPINPSYQAGGDHRTLDDKSSLIPHGVEAHIKSSMGEPSSSARECGCTMTDSAYQVKSNECHADADQSYPMSKALEIDDNLSMRRKDRASNLPDRELELVSRNGCGDQVLSPATPIKAAPDSKGAEPFTDRSVSPELHSLRTTVVETSSSPERAGISHSNTQREDSIPPTAAEGIIPTKGATAQGLRKTRSMSLISTNPAQPPKYGKSSASRGAKVEVKSKDCIKRQIVRVVIPTAPSSHPLVRLPLVSTETEDPAINRKLSATAESGSAALGPSLPYQENLAIRTPTRSPSVAAAESQYAASAAFLVDGVRTSMGPEIADSQPLSTMPVVATPVPEVGTHATRPIILDADSPPLTMDLGAGSSAGKQPKETTQTIILECDTQPLRVTPGIVTPAQKRTEETTESDILESGSHPLHKTLSAARSLSMRARKETIAASSSSMWPAIDDYSEDELSYL